ncbi:hypothetical protein BX616_001081 [Lobosporangium transversale]|uniref:FAD/NAD(P)-binding domain-containing protein n=1 Tax=Lobosporangium transversale TaxID=64571 RepID=A0A1Y2GPL0_9FUNG|nr:hypothetical protein BCR41DRAFT_322094 [Lobosporangium transversale]KAF9917412.1 hypothetical protein BX616_001081 [Lobosporangium transversale]ORZ17609.1 hypothetical protein BCR41DRAFT_322094 [Lobosporangium transversale]|eukprot:XP_021881996.1 hypothetical protein BCR41DRAFT_322094 [Lobosporangium transversale]
MGLTKTFPDGSTPTVAIIGAGLSGICAAIQLQRKLQLTTYRVFELESDIGGTWLNNTYPGCQSDAPAHLYSYSFAPNYDFSKKFVPQSEVLAYLRATAKTFNIYDKIQFRAQVTSMRWDEGRNKWILRWVKVPGSQGEAAEDADGSLDHQAQVENIYEADVVLHAAGLLRLPKIPEEFEAFDGPKWHSARWNHSVDLTGKRVGVVGASASGIQIVPAIANKVQSLQVYGRSPSHITPQLNYSYNRIWKFLFHYVPFFYTLYRVFWYYYVDSTILLYHKLAWYSVFHRAIVYFVTWFHRFRQFPFDRSMREKLTPRHEVASRRVVLSDTFFPALKLPHVHFHQDPIVKVSGKTIETKDGSKNELDVLILATGFNWLAGYPVGYWTGRGGVDIATSWGHSPTTYYGTCVPDAPNFFLIWGPNSGIAHHALTSNIEVQVMYAIRALSYMMEKDVASIEIKKEAAEEFLELLDRRMERMIFTTKVDPRFINEKGKCRGFWFSGVTEFWWHMKDLHPERYHVLRREEALKNRPHMNGEKHELDGNKHKDKEA